MFEEAQPRPRSARLHAVGSRRPVETPEGCLMEITARLAGEPWTDHPECVHATLGSVARSVYDHSSAAARAELLPLAPSLIGTAVAGFETSARLVATCVSTALCSPVPERIAAEESRRLEAARRTAMYLLARSGATDPDAGAGTEPPPRLRTRMWLCALDPLRLTEPLYRRLVSAEVVAEAVAVAARASGSERDRRLSQLLRWCVTLTRRTQGKRPGEDRPHHLHG
jgi:hypothetical protein